MKGLLKGLRYFSHMFEEEKEPEIQIGAPTDVKHVAHIGWDGPSSVETPSWMKEFKSSGGVETASVGAAPKNSFRADEGKSTRELPDIPKSSRQIISQENTYSQSPSRETSTTKSRQSKRTQYKDSSSDGSKSIMEPDQSPSRNPTDVVAATKKSRRKKSKESINVGPSKSTRSKPRERDSSSSSSSTNTNTMQPYPDPGQPMSGSNKGNNDIYQNSSSSSKPIIYTRGNEDKW